LRQSKKEREKEMKLSYDTLILLATMGDVEALSLMISADDGDTYYLSELDSMVFFMA
jgi:hypothetical protein